MRQQTPLTFHPLAREHALAILNWRYPPPYDFYNFDAETHQADLDYLINPQNAFYALLNQRRILEGYCSFGLDGQVPGGHYSAEALDLGMGIRPDLVGQGLGKHYAQAVARYGLNQSGAKQLRVTIAAFNQRAQAIWIQLGFKLREKFTKTDSEEEFVVMTCSPSSLCSLSPHLPIFPIPTKQYRD